MLTGPTRCAFRDIGVIAVKLEHFACTARLLDQLLLPLRWDRYGTRLAGGQMHDARTVLKYVPSAGFQAPGIFQRDAKCRPPRAQCQVNPSLAGSLCRIPDAGVNETARADQCAIHIDTDQSNH